MGAVAIELRPIELIKLLERERERKKVGRVAEDTTNKWGRGARNE
jgi:hypothetical protein